MKIAGKTNDKHPQSPRDGCAEGQHNPRLHAGDEPPAVIVCVCGAKMWRREPCPTCGHERYV